MIEIRNVETYGWEAAIRGMRNPLNSWAKSDSKIEAINVGDIINDYTASSSFKVSIGENDLSLMKRLISAGSDHRKFLRQIFISMDIKAGLHFWKEFDTYKIGTATNSCSTMHKIHSEPITRDCFAFTDCDNKEYVKMQDSIIEYCEHLRQKYVETNDKKYWRLLIEILPESWLQLRTVTLNYEVAYRIYQARKNHKLEEWHILCSKFENLPYFKEMFDITRAEENLSCKSTINTVELFNNKNKINTEELRKQCNYE